MRRTQLLIPTLKENPSEAEIASHRYMLRTGMIRQVAAGIYSLLPLGLRVLRKVEGIVREEMNRAGAQEISMPAIIPAELWKETDRWDAIGKELLRIKDRHDRDFCFGPTHEEVVTDIVRRELRSYRDFPKNLYQIQVKFRDETRPRFGLMRGREFVMKDAYSFDIDSESADQSYDAMYEAYCRIFERCGLNFRAVDADSGNIGGSRSQEFMVLAPSGEDEITSCEECDYAANVEKAEAKAVKISLKDLGDLSETATPGKKTIRDVAEFLGLTESQLLKTLLYKTEKSYVAVVLPGDRDVNEIKLKSILEVSHLDLASEKEIYDTTGSPFGFLGPIGLKTSPGKVGTVLVSNLIGEGVSYVVGGNKKDIHLLGAQLGRDFKGSQSVDLHLARPGDLCARCGGTLRFDRGIEVGHIFMLGTKYSEAMQATFADPKGEMKPAVMGCYGIGIGRTAAAAIEQNHDENGIIFPPPLAPFDVTIVPLPWTNEEIQAKAEDLEKELEEAGLSVLLDDRDSPAGVKFKDADLFGIPVRVTVGAKGMKQGKVEVKSRWKSEAEFIDPKNLLGWIKDCMESFGKEKIDEKTNR